MKALVLGGNGFIGSHVVDRLLAAGYVVRVFDHSPEQYRAPLESVEYIYGEFGDIDALQSALADIDVVFHLISTTVPSTSNDDPIADISGNLIGTLRLLDMAVRQDIRRLVFLSSGGTVYGIPDKIPVSEDMPTRPICSHGVTKLAIEKYLYMHHSLYGLEYTVLRVSNPYGERQGHIGVQGVVGTFVNRTLQGLDVEVWGDGSVERDYVYVDDVAEACILAIDCTANEIFNIGSGEGTSIDRIVAELSNASGQRICPIYKDGRTFDVPKIVLGCSKASRVMGWQPKTALAQGIAKTWNWAEYVSRPPRSGETGEETGAKS